MNPLSLSYAFQNLNIWSTQPHPMGYETDPFNGHEYFYTTELETTYNLKELADEYRDYHQDSDNWVKFMGQGFASDWINQTTYHAALAQLQGQSFGLLFRYIPSLSELVDMINSTRANNNNLSQIYIAEARDSFKTHFSDEERYTFSEIYRRYNKQISWVYGNKLYAYTEKSHDAKIGSGVFIEPNKAEEYKKSINLVIYGTAPYRAQSYLDSIAEYLNSRKKAAMIARRESHPVTFVTTGGTSVANIGNLIAYNCGAISVARPVDYTGSPTLKHLRTEKTDVSQLHGLMIYPIFSGIERHLSSPGDMIILFPGGIETNAQLYGELQNIAVSGPRVIILAGDDAEEWKEKILPVFNSLLRGKQNGEAGWIYGCMVYVENGKEAAEVVDAYMNRTLKIGPGFTCNANYGFQLWKQMKNEPS